MVLLSQLKEILLQCPFDEKGNYCLHTAQCQALSVYFSSNLERFFGTILRPPSLDSSPGMASRRWNSFSVFYDNTFLKLWSSRKENKSSSATLSDGYSVSAILQELTRVPYAIEELYRVVKEADNYLRICSNPEWWRAAISMGIMTEVRDVHIHDLMWCIAGLKLALQAVRGVELESRAQFTRLGIAECFAEMGALSSQYSKLVCLEEQDHAHLLSVLQQMKHKYDEMNFVRKKVMNTPEKLKHETVHFLLQKLRVPSSTTELDSTSFFVRKPPQSMHICSQDLMFSSQACVIARGSFTAVYEASWLGIKVAAKQFNYHTCEELFNYEAAVLIEVQCPFVVQLYGWSVDTQNYTCCLVLELVKDNLATHVKERRDSKKPLNWLPVVMDLMLQLSRAMEYLHSKKIIHRNLKPSSILVEPLSSSRELMEKGYGRVKLCNFGSGRLNLDISHESTMGYRAPEVWALQDRNRVEQLEYTFEADVYSFGMTFAYSLTGEEPFAGITSKAVMREMLRKGASPELPAGCPHLLKELLQKCWSRDPSSRPSFSTITMMLRHLKLLMMKTRTSDRLPDCLVDKEFSLSTPVISYTELCVATNNFTNKVQNITLHSIYHGVFSDGTKVLIQHIRDIINIRKIWIKISQMLRLRHSNIVGLRAVCIHASQCWFVFENTSVQGSLGWWLADDKLQEPLDIATCYRIAVGVACGLQYLHCQDNVFAVTIENILLDEKYEPQILMDSLAFEERVNDLDFHQRLDVLHFGNLITKLLYYLSTNGVDLDSSTQDFQATMLQRVESLCITASDVKMDGVVEMLELGYETHPEDNSSLNPLQEDYLEFHGSIRVEREMDSTDILESQYAVLNSMSVDLRQDLVEYNGSLTDEPVDRRETPYFTI